MGVGFTLLPRFARFYHSSAAAHRWSIAVVIAAVARPRFRALAPLLERWLLGGQVPLDGAARRGVVQWHREDRHAFARAAAPRSRRRQPHLSTGPAGCRQFAIGSAVVAAPWGLTGVVYGVGAGWLAWAVMAFVVVSHHLRLPAAVAAETR